MNMLSKDKFVQEDLRTSQGTEGQLLIMRKIYDTLIPEVERQTIPRELAAYVYGPSDIPGSSIDVDLTNVGAMKVRLVGEGGEIFLSDPEFSTVNIKPDKYGLRTNITREMMEDGKWNLLQQAQMTAARRFAEHETSLIFSQALDNATTTTAGGAALTIANINTAILDLQDDDYEATDALIGNEAYSDLRNIDTFVEADKSGSTDALRRGFIGTVFGVRLWRFSTNAAPSTTYSKYMYIFDRQNAFVIAEKRPLTVEPYTLPTHDVQGVAITKRFRCRHLRASAISKITTS